MVVLFTSDRGKRKSPEFTKPQKVFSNLKCQSEGDTQGGPTGSEEKGMEGCREDRGKEWLGGRQWEVCKVSK